MRLWCSMNGRTDVDRISDLLHYAQEAIVILGGASYADFCDDRKTQLAILYLITVIGEAASRTGDDTLRMFPGIPWHQVRGARNRLVHAYFAVDFKVVYDIVVYDLPQLVAALAGAAAGTTAGSNQQGGQLL